MGASASLALPLRQLVWTGAVLPVSFGPEPEPKTGRSYRLLRDALWDGMDQRTLRKEGTAGFFLSQPCALPQPQFPL